MNQQQTINRQGQQYIATLAWARKRVWQDACKHDDIPPNSSFVVFSEDNPFVRFINLIQKRLNEAEAAYAAGGYVGLTMKG
jgi:hypothetical protein